MRIEFETTRFMKALGACVSNGPASRTQCRSLVRNLVLVEPNAAINCDLPHE